MPPLNNDRAGPAAGADGVAARAVALDLLDAVLRRRRALDAALADHPGHARLVKRYRAFVRQLTATTLRRLGQIDAVLDACLERPLPDRAAATRDALRLGCCQLLFLATPGYAAVDSAVTLVAGRSGQAGYRGLVNAVLRRVARDRDRWLAALPDPMLNAPPWLVRSWQSAYGAATAAAIMAAHVEAPPLDLTVKADPASWAERLGATVLPTGSLRRSPRETESASGGAIEELPGYHEGAWWVQDAAAALPVRLLGSVAGRTVIDLCAAPGGKTAQLAAAGASVTTVDRSPTRLERVAQNLKRLGLVADPVVADATLWQPAAPADAVLVDAPCSATGVIRRHPDVPWLKTPQDLPKLAALQDRLLAAAAGMLAPGGLLVYCSCSLQPEEGPARIAALLAQGAPYVRRPIAAAEIGGLSECVSPEGDLRTLPCHLADRGGLDGFYAARLQRA